MVITELTGENVRWVYDESLKVADLWKAIRFEPESSYLEPSLRLLAGSFYVKWALELKIDSEFSWLFFIIKT